MRTIFIAAAVMFVVARANAAAYDDYARGVNANNQGASELAVESFTAALNAGDLAPPLVTQAYRGRAIAYSRLDQCDHALTDLDAALKLDPHLAYLKPMHAWSEDCVGASDIAIAELDALIAAGPSTDLYGYRAFAKWHAGRFADAAADFRQAASMARTRTYTDLWAVMSEFRAPEPNIGRIAADAAAASGNDWPRPVFNLFLGKIKPDDVMAAAIEGDASGKAGRQCEANFYVAEWWLARGAVDTADPLLKAAVDSCPHDFTEFRAATYERQRLSGRGNTK